MKVLKFGGTSVGSVDTIRSLPDLIEGEITNQPLFIVVSAFAGVTNELSGLTEQSLQSFETAKTSVEAIKQRHLQVLNELTGEREAVYIEEVISDILDICHGISLLGERTNRSQDFIITCGELLSSFIISKFLAQTFETQLFNSKDYLFLRKNGGMDYEISAAKLQEISKLATVNIFPGFIASKENGTVTSLGRGGSDYTASLLANFFDVEELQIWTDVSGIMSADPRIVNQAQVLDHLSYEEAMEISHFGAKVVYPPSIQPALKKEIPIVIKNTFDPKTPGTVITKEWDQDKTLIRGISSIKQIVLLNLTGAGMVGIPSFSHRFFRVLSESKINVIMITQASSEHSICVAIAENELEKALDGLNDEFASELQDKSLNEIEVKKDLAIIALVGSNMRHQSGVSGKMFSVLGKNGVNIIAIAQGSSERNISAVISESDLQKALNSLHESFFLSEVKRINLFVIGVGNVGQSFLGQLKSQESTLQEKHNLKISLVGLANSKKMLFEKNGISYNNWKERLNDGEKFSADGYVQRMKELNMRNSIFIDVTASDSIAELYKDVLAESISVVTPNKIGATKSFQSYEKLQLLSQRNNAQFLIETNVAAGLPVISTLKDLIKSGDRIERIEAVLSGTLNYIFNTYDGSSSFVEVVKDAQQKGLTEPDPRLDLFGEDVKRKILILARESGENLELADVEYDHFVPSDCVEANSMDDFYLLLEKNEEHFKTITQKAKDNNCKLRVVAQYGDHKAKVELQEVSKNHPFYNLEGKDNIVLFYTKRYHDNPLVIKGAGAGAEVTASGIFADILKVSSN